MVKGDKNIAFRIVFLLLGAPTAGAFSSSTHERFFVSICLLWSLILCGAFQVSWTKKFFSFSPFKLNLRSVTARKGRLPLTFGGYRTSFAVKSVIWFRVSEGEKRFRPIYPFTQYLLTIDLIPVRPA